MKACSVDLKGSDAVLCMMTLTDEGLFEVHDCRQSKITLKSPDDSESMNAFQFAFAKLMQDYSIEHVVIRERPKGGKFAGGAVGFKMEAAIQLIADLNVDVMPGSVMKEQLKKTPMFVDLKDVGLKKFHEVAFQTGFAWLHHQAYLKHCGQ